MKKIFVFVIFAVLIISSVSFVLADGNQSDQDNGDHEDNATINVTCADAPIQDTFCEEGEFLYTSGYEDDGCPEWDCQSNSVNSTEDDDEESTPPGPKDRFICCGFIPRDTSSDKTIYEWKLKRNCVDPDTLIVNNSYCKDVEKPETEVEFEGNGNSYKYKYKYKNANGQEVEQEVEFEYGHDNRWKFRAGNYSVICPEDCNLTGNQTGNETHFRAQFSNGRYALVKVMPDVAAEKALERLRLKNCVEDEGCTIELKEVSKNRLRINQTNETENQTQLAYELKTERQAKVFGFIKSRMKVRAEIDAETGDITSIHKPWWAFLASEPQQQ